MADTLIEERLHHRRVLVRTAALYVPCGIFATVLLVLSLVSLFTGNIGAIFAVVLLGLISFAVDYEGIAALRDLRGHPIDTEGPIQRSWSKGRFAFVGRVHYLLVERRVFEVNGATALELHEGDRVRIDHWPHTNTVIAVHKLPRTSAGPGSAASSR